VLPAGAGFVHWACGRPRSTRASLLHQLLLCRLPAGGSVGLYPPLLAAARVALATPTAAQLRGVTALQPWRPGGLLRCVGSKLSGTLAGPRRRATRAPDVRSGRCGVACPFSRPLPALAMRMALCFRFDVIHRTADAAPRRYMGARGAGARALALLFAALQPYPRARAGLDLTLGLARPGVRGIWPAQARAGAATLLPGAGTALASPLPLSALPPDYALPATAPHPESGSSCPPALRIRRPPALARS